ncbi:MAG TPA: hypothetical protein VG101_15465 [Puia sp.]|jgi:hypothetical protein|nr:hypothetical protein [Puia sp.]
MDKKPAALAWIFLATIFQPAVLQAGISRLPTDTVPGKLLYVVEGAESYMIPYIERKLKNLRQPNSDILLYDSVASLNTLTQTSSIEVKIIDVFNEIYSGNYVAESPAKQASVAKQYSYYSGFLKSFQSVLAIKVNSFLDLIEFQFTLYDISNKGRNIHYRNSSSVFVDPKSAHYQANIISTLNQVFDRANRQPEFRILSNLTKQADTFYLSTEDSLWLEPIVDDESSEDDRLYFWSQGHDSVPLHIDASKKDLLLKKLRPGRYTLSFRTSNGISYSRTENIHICVYVKPLLTIAIPYSPSLFGAPNDALIIQEYLPGPRHVEYFSKYLAIFSPGAFSGGPAKLYLKIVDKKGSAYLGKTFEGPRPGENTLFFNFGDHNYMILENIDTTEFDLPGGNSNTYTMEFVAKSAAMQSNEVRKELHVVQRRAISLVYDAMISPLPQNSLFHSWLNVGLGFDFHINSFLLVTGIFGTNTANKSFAHYYSTFAANLIIPGNRFQGGPAILVNHDNGTVNLGLRVSYTVVRGGRSDIKLGISYFNMGDVDINALHYTGNVFFIH